MKLLLFTALLPLAATAAVQTPRALYNEGLQKLQRGELRDAEDLLRRSAASGDEASLTPALYNLGHVRFLQGKETLKGETNGKALTSAARDAMESALDAARAGASALENDSLEEILGAYQQVRGARRELRFSSEAATRTLDVQATALGRWQRSLGDFRSAAELSPQDGDAPFNADVVERHIQELKKKREELQQNAEAVQQMRDALKKMSGALRKKIPKEMMRESDGEEEDEDEEEQESKGDKPPQKQQQQRIGGEREISQEMSEWLKESLKQRTLSIGADGEPLGPQERNGPGTERDLLGTPGGPGQDPNAPRGPGGQNQRNGGGDSQQRGKKGKDW